MPATSPQLVCYLFKKATDLVEVAVALEHEHFALPLAGTGSLDRKTRVRARAAIERFLCCIRYLKCSFAYRIVLVSLSKAPSLVEKTTFRRGSIANRSNFLSSAIRQCASVSVNNQKQDQGTENQDHEKLKTYK